MLQRAGLAQALMNDPELVVLDEPMSGLDPIGRKEVRDLILELRDQGKTVFFSSHILTDVEAIADHVAIIARGQLQAQGTPAELVKRTVLGVDVTCASPRRADDSRAIAAGASHVRRAGDELSLTLPADADVDAWLARARELEARRSSRSRRATRRSRICSCARSRAPMHRLPRPRAGHDCVIGRIWAIALNTFREAARIRVLYGIVVRRRRREPLRDRARPAVDPRGRARRARHRARRRSRSFGSLTAIFLGVFLLYTEVQRRTIHAIVSKPIERWEFVVGKYVGMALVLTRARRAVRARDGRACCSSKASRVSVAVVEAIVLAWIEVLIVAAIAIFFSSFSTPFLSGDLRARDVGARPRHAGYRGRRPRRRARDRE